MSIHIYLQWSKGLPIEVLPFAYKPVKLRLEKMGGAAELRMAQKKAVSMMFQIKFQLTLYAVMYYCCLCRVLWLLTMEILYWIGSSTPQR